MRLPGALAGAALFNWPCLLDDLTFKQQAEQYNKLDTAEGIITAQRAKSYSDEQAARVPWGT